jgi:hypothetical protein
LKPGFSSQDKVREGLTAALDRKAAAGRHPDLQRGGSSSADPFAGITPSNRSVMGTVAVSSHRLIL